MPKKPLSQHLWAVNMLKCLKHSLNVRGCTFVIFFGHYEMESAGKILF